MLAVLKNAVGELLDLLLPAACPLCGNLLGRGTTADFCPDCRSAIPALPSPRCSRCALPFATEGGVDHLCAVCLREPQPDFFRVHAAGCYAGLLRQAVQRFKYSGDIGLDRPLANLLADRLDPPLAELLVPVPLHSGRLRARSYNQSLLLARCLGRRLGLPVAPGMLCRTRPTPPQQGLAAAVRRSNLRGAFALGEDPRERRILLVDDVLTTGSTVRECARVLMAGGAAAVEVAVVARAPQPGFMALAREEKSVSVY